MNILTNVEMAIEGVSPVPHTSQGFIYVAVAHEQGLSPEEIQALALDALERRVKILKARRRATL